MKGIFVCDWEEVEDEYFMLVCSFMNEMKEFGKKVVMLYVEVEVINVDKKIVL